ncbi:hypothetical protein, partial [Enterobacter hormaechei]|uniref:hypothetical protein n=1 Tax=Enterobacter hormaechei TaxID=158836 RepID=UPI001954FB33
AGQRPCRSRTATERTVREWPQPDLDALEWIGLARGGNDDDGMPLRAVDVQGGKLMLIGGVFEQTRLQLRPGAQALDVRLDGPSLAGRLTVP